MGRSKIAMEFIEDPIKRRTTMKKRLQGFKKKAQELHILTGARIHFRALYEGHVYEYDSELPEENKQEDYIQHEIIKHHDRDGEIIRGTDDRDVEIICGSDDWDIHEDEGDESDDDEDSDMDFFRYANAEVGTSGQLYTYDANADVEFAPSFQPIQRYYSFEYEDDVDSYLNIPAEFCTRQRNRWGKTREKRFEGMIRLGLLGLGRVVRMDDDSDDEDCWSMKITTPLDCNASFTIDDAHCHRHHCHHWSPGPCLPRTYHCHSPRSCSPVRIRVGDDTTVLTSRSHSSPAVSIRARSSSPCSSDVRITVDSDDVDCKLRALKDEIDCQVNRLRDLVDCCCDDHRYHCLLHEISCHRIESCIDSVLRCRMLESLECGAISRMDCILDSKLREIRDIYDCAVNARMRDVLDGVMRDLHMCKLRLHCH